MKAIKEWFKTQIEIIKDEFTNEPPLKILKNFLFIFLGACIVAFGDAFFLIKMDIIAGGVSSISLLIYKIPGFDALSINVYVLIVTWVFFFLGLILLGVKYAFHTLIYTITHPLMNMFYSFLIKNVTVDGVNILDITQICKDISISGGTISATTNQDAMLILAYFVAAIIGGLLVGSGIGFTLSGGGSSGGTDVINLLANKYLHVKVGTSSFVIDSCLIIAGFFTNGYNLLPTLVGLIAALLCSIMIDKVFMGNNQYYLAMIISSKWEDINNFINNELGRGTTIFKGMGGYTKKDSYILEVCFDRQDYNIIRETINTIDPNAFFTVMQTKEVLGYGFSRNTPKAKKKGVTITAEEARHLISKARTKNKNTFKEQ